MFDELNEIGNGGIPPPYYKTKIFNFDKFMYRVSTKCGFWVLGFLGHPTKLGTTLTDHLRGKEAWRPPSKWITRFFWEPIFLCIFQKNSAVATYSLKEMGKFLRKGREKGFEGKGIYSQVPNKQVGPNKRVGWLFWTYFISKLANFQPYLFIWAYSFMKFAQNNHPTLLFCPTCLFGTWE